MKRATIDFGIDLGTTNSSIAVCNGSQTEIIKNEDNFETTPSAVYMDARGRTFVGRAALGRFSDDRESLNVQVQFKRQMGKADQIHFPSANASRLPEELSAEVLKDLRKNVAQHLSEEVGAAVITVPADFASHQVEATNKAAALAGFRQCIMLTEPVAAAMAYGFEKRPEKSRWLVYDFGGGTFDAALIQVRDGIIQVRDNAGNKFLGGKNMDEAIVDQLLIPAVRAQCGLADFGRAQPRWKSALAKLTFMAETAKIRLSRAQSAEIIIENIDGSGADFEFELERSRMEAVAAPFILQSVRFCRQLLEQNQLGDGDVDRILLVGGPTLMPLLRQMLGDRTTGLGIPLEFSVDPFTVVARGAAVFAATQPLDLPEGGPAAGEYHVRVDYSAIGPDYDPQVSGQVIGGAPSYTGWSIEFVNTTARPAWRSGRLALTQDGRFLATLLAQGSETNHFQIELTDNFGTLQRTTPAVIPYTVNTAPEPNPPLIHDIGVALADNTVETFFKKGTPLPARCRKILRTAAAARPGQQGQAIQIPIIQGNFPRADRNERVGSLDIPIDRLRRELPAGSEVEVTIEVDRSRRYITRAYLPTLGDDGEFEVELIKSQATIDAARLEQEAAAARKRADDLRQQAEQRGDSQAQKLIEDIEQEQLPQELDQCAQAAHHDQDAADRADNLRRGLDARLDAVEAALEWPKLQDEAREEITRSREVAEKHGDEADKRAMRVNIAEVEEALRLKDKAMLRHRLGEMETLKFSILRKMPEFWAGLFLNLEEDARFRGNSEAQRLFGEGRRAILNNNMDALQGICRQLLSLVGSSEAAIAGNIGVTR